jgi:Alkylmercury lyase
VPAALTGAERALYHWILRRFGAGNAPAAHALGTEARRHGLDPDRALATLAAEDLVHTNEHGEVTVAYPFSGRLTVHRVSIDGGPELHAMCAIDALGIASMLERPIAVASRDLVDGTTIDVRVKPDGQAVWQPTEAVVLAGRACEGPSFRGCCRVLNFFASAGNAERYLRAHREVAGFRISIPEAVVVGETVFGGIFVED